MTKHPERTADKRHVVIDGRKWRASDPAIPEKLRAELVSALMAGRRGVRSHGEVARVVVQDAKVALGERGDPWWEPTPEGTRERLAATIRTLLRSRGGSTICPSDAARAVGGAQWRDLMETAREVARELRAEGVVRILKGGEEVAGDARGPIRIAVGDGLEMAGG